MKVLIVYDTRYGMTEKIAHAISSGLNGGGIADLAIKKAEDTSAEDFKKSDAWVVGSPTHIGGPTGAVKKAMKMALESGTEGKAGTAFDTRFASAKNGATDKLKRTMEEGGIKVVVEPEWFIVLKSKGPLAAGEEEKAVAFGKKIASALNL